MPEQTIRAGDARDAPAGATPDAGAWRLAETLGARLCHDLAGSVGTLAGAVEMLAEADGRDPDALREAEQAARELAARLRLLRAAWGGECDVLDRDGILALLPGLASSGRVAVDLSGLTRRYPEPFARALLNLLLLAHEAVSRGGTVLLADDPGGGVLARIEGPHAAWPPALAALLAAGDDGADDATSGPAVAAGPRGMQAPLLVALARRAGLRLRFVATRPGPAAPPALLLHDGG